MAATTGPPAVHAVDVSKSYGELVAVNAITVEVGQGEVYGILGPNGAGKTTFMRMLFGLIRPDSGEIRLFGRTWARDGTRVLDRVAGFVETPRFYPYLTARENLRGLARLDGGAATWHVDRVLEVVDLGSRGDDKVREFSYGMVQRLGVAASLLRDPQLLVVDEPANGLDPAGIRDMRALIKRLGESGLTVLLSSHDMGEVEEICDNVTIMRRGDVAFHGSIAELREQAPEQGHRVATDNDARARAMGRRFPKLVVKEAGEGGFSVVGPQDEVDRYIRALVGEGVALRSFEYAETPLETLFFMLTETGPNRPLGDAEARHAA
jgi:ABC-2 type transport system ATP-binding protein